RPRRAAPKIRHAHPSSRPRSHGGDLRPIAEHRDREAPRLAGRLMAHARRRQIKPNRETTNMAGVLAGIRVLDFGRYIAGPYCAALLAEHGAEVIRIEKREGSEDRFQAPVTPTGDGALFMQMNRTKRGMTLDPMRPEGREVVARLVKTADVVIANLPPQTLSAMGLDYASLTAIQPDVILTTVSAYGRGGPYSDRVGF